MRHLALAVPALLLALSLGCGDRRNRETGGVSDTSVSVTTPPPAEAPIEARDFSFDEREGFAASIRQQLAELDGRIEQLAAQTKPKGGAVSDRAVARIRESRKVVDRNLSRIDRATADTWEAVKARVNRSVEDVSEGVEAAMPK